MPDPTLSVIVPHFDDLLRLRRCLDALDVQTIARDSFEIIVADNVSPCGLQAIEAIVAGRGLVVSQSERGAGPARNAGVTAAKGRLLAFIDSDCVASPNWAQAGMAALDKYDLVGGHVAVFAESGEEMTGPEAFEAVFAFDFKSYIEKKGFAGTGNLFCARSTFDLVGHFRVGMSEDMDWCFRARAAGFSLGYAPDALVGHPARGDWKQLVHKWRRIQAELYALKAHSRANTIVWLVRAWLMPFSVIAHAPKVIASRELSPREKLRALGCLAKLRIWRMVNAHRLVMGKKD